MTDVEEKSEKVGGTQGGGIAQLGVVRGDGVGRGW